VRVLVVSDDAEERALLRAMLERVGFGVHAASGGAEALQSFESYRPHLALVDGSAKAPGGVPAVRAIRGRPSGRRAPLVTLLPPSSDGVPDSVVEAAADGVLRRPLAEEEVLGELRKHLGIEYRYASAVETVRPPDPGELDKLSAGALPDATRGELLEALRVADYDRLLELLGALAPEHAAVGVAMRALVEGYAYVELDAFLRRTR
jgi:CheY-like chemotaxis protein